MRLKYSQLTFGATAEAQHTSDVREFGGAAQPMSDGGERGDQFAQVLSQRHFRTVPVDDDLCIETVARCAPFVLAHEPWLEAGEALAAVEDGLEMLRHALGERGQSADLRERRCAIARSNLDGAPARRRSNVPAGLGWLRDNARFCEVSEHPLDIAPLVEIPRESGRRKLLEHEGSIGRVPGGVAGPQGAGSGQCQQVGEMGEKCVHERHHTILPIHSDVHVHPPNEHVPAPPAVAFNEAVVSFARGDSLFLPAAKRMASRADQRRAVMRRNGLHGTCEGAQIRGRVAHPCVGCRDQFDGVLE